MVNDDTLCARCGSRLADHIVILWNKPGIFGASIALCPTSVFLGACPDGEGVTRRPAREMSDLERVVRGTESIDVLFRCPTCGRAHEPKDLGTSLQCRSCENGRPSPDRSRCPDCTGVLVPPDDSLWFGPEPRKDA